MMDWITDTEVAAIRDRVARETFEKRKSHTYYWYARFFWFALAACWLVASLITLGHDRRTVEGLVLCLVASIYYQAQWERHRERYVFQVEIGKTEESNQPSEGTR